MEASSASTQSCLRFKALVACSSCYGSHRQDDKEIRRGVFAELEIIPRTSNGGIASFEKSRGTTAEHHQGSKRKFSEEAEYKQASG